MITIRKSGKRFCEKVAMRKAFDSTSIETLLKTILNWSLSARPGEDPMQNAAPQMSMKWGRPVWFIALVAASVGFSLGFACAVPLAAFAAVAALTMPRAAALLLILAIVLANQCIGFTVLHYPLALETLGWAGGFALVGVLSVLAAGWVKDRSASAHPIRVSVMAFLVAFGVYEGVFFVITVASASGLEPYAAPVVLRIFAINATAFAGLCMARRIAASMGLAESQTGRFGMTHRPI